MAEVLTSAGLADYYATGQIPKFEKPGATKADESPQVVPAEAKAEVKPEIKPEVKAEADDEDEGEGELSERAKRIIARKERSIDKKHREMKEAEEMARDQFATRQAAEKRAEDLAAELAALKSQAAKAPEKTREDFKSDEEWIDYRAELRIEAKEKARLETELKAEQDALQNAYFERREAYRAEVGDWEETMRNLEKRAVGVTPAMEQYFWESDVGERVLYHLGKHPDEFARIAAIKVPTRAIKELVKIESTLSSLAPTDEGDKPAPKSDGKTLISRAPAPITPIAENTSPVHKDPSKMTFDELRAHTRAERLRRARH